MTENYGPQVDPVATTGPQSTGPRTIAQRYALLAELGRGGMGVVWRGEDRTIGRQVAIKELRGPDDPDEAAVFQERVLREVRTGGRINDPAVVTVYDVVTEGDATYIVMELVEAPTLSQVIAEQGSLPPTRVATIGGQVLSALRAAHNAGIVHRDVKPGNIMVAANGRVKLTDFGIAQAVDDPRLTTSGNLVGSPAFMAPERVAGSEAVPASDLWSLGAALFFAVEGFVAFERTSTAATLHAIMNEVPYLTHTQGPLASAIMGLLIGSPDARLTAEQAHDLLAMAARPGQSTAMDVSPAGATARIPGSPSAMADGATTVRPATGASRTGRGRGRWVVAGSAVAGVMLLVGGVFLGKWMFGAGTDDQRAETLSYGQGGDISQLNYDSDYSTLDCADSMVEPGAKLTDESWIDCDDLHAAEIYLDGTVYGDSDDDDADPAKYPPPEKLRTVAEQHCRLAFHSNAIDDSARSGLRYRALVPSRAAWQRRPESATDSATRDYYCVVSKRDNSPLKQSVRNEVR